MIRTEATAYRVLFQISDNGYDMIIQLLISDYERTISRMVGEYGPSTPNDNSAS